MNKKIVIIIMLMLIIGIGVLIGIMMLNPKKVNTVINPVNGTESEIFIDMPEGSQVKIPEDEVEKTVIGIDVSKYQGDIDWKQVADAGIKFAMVRVGYRTMVGGEILEDPMATENLREAGEQGIHLGVYFFSTAISVEEAIEEANWVADYISDYKITYPVAYNCEGFDEMDSRQFGMKKSERSKAALAFLNQISERGYYGMFYASKREMEYNIRWNTSDIEKRYKIWVAQYPENAYPKTPASDYNRIHAMWQYSNHGKVPGIDAAVDLNVAYFGY